MIDVQLEAFGKLFWTHVSTCPACMVKLPDASSKGMRDKINSMDIRDYAREYCCKVGIELVAGQMKIEAGKRN